MVGTGANRMPLTKIHPILLGKQKSEGTSLLAQHRQQFQQQQERRQDQTQMGPNPNQHMGGPRPPRGHLPSMQPPLPSSHQPPGFPHQPPQPSYAPPPQSLRYPPPNMYQQQRPPAPFPPHGRMQPPPPQPQYRSPSQPPPPPMDNSFDRKSPPRIEDGRGREPTRDPPTNVSTSDASAPVKKKRKSRWGAADDKVMTGPNMTLPANLTEEQRKQYLIQFKIEEITQKLRTGELGIPPDPADRSPSPEPIYNSEGKRLNTREFRVRKALEEERHVLIKQAVDEIPNYKPPIDYKPPASKICDKVFIPSERNPAVNFIGLLIGPRGNTLKRLEKETGCKIIIRGKGSVKEGKVGRIPGQLMPGEDEPLHALITGPTEAEVKKGVQVVGDIVKEGIECPDAANELRRNQLRELAELNGTLIDDEVIKCKNCGATDHRHWECTERKNVTSEITCNKCGGYGHVAADCKVKVESNAAPTQTFAEKAKMDTEYMSLMAELGVDAPPPPPKRVFQEAPTSSATTTSTTSTSATPSSTSTPATTGSKPSVNNTPSRPNMSTRLPSLPAPPKESNIRSPSNPNKWGPPASSDPPKSLMDIDVGAGSGNPKQFGGGRPDGPRGPRPDGPRGPRPDGPRGPRPDGSRGPRPDGPCGPRMDGLRGGPRPDGLRGGPRPDGSRGGPRPDGLRGPRPDGPRGPRPDGPRGPRPDGRGMPPPWRNRGPPAPLMQSQSGGGRGGAVPPWQQMGPPHRGPPPSNSNFGPPSSNSSFGPPSSNSGGFGPAQNSRMEHPQRAPPANNAQGGPPPPQHADFPGQQWQQQPYGFNPNHAPPNNYGGVPAPWAQQPPPPPPPPPAE